MSKIASSAVAAPAAQAANKSAKEFRRNVVTRFLQASADLSWRGGLLYWFSTLLDLCGYRPALHLARPFLGHLNARQEVHRPQACHARKRQPTVVSNRFSRSGRDS
jgi:hypothetical protein